MERALLFLYAETPVHVGADASQGTIDLPIQRDVSTGLPIIKAESLKGALRESFRPPKEKKRERDRWVRIFGAEPPSPGTAADKLASGSLRVHEAQLVAFPAPALARTFVWVTSPLARAWLERKARLAGVRLAPQTDPGETRPEEAASAQPSDGVCLAAGRHDGRVALGPYLVDIRHAPALAAWAQTLASLALPDIAEYAYFREKLAADLHLCSDELLAAISRDCAPVAARVQLGTGEVDRAARKTVQYGPFHSEYLPSETLLVALLECDDHDHLLHVGQGLDHSVLRVGGDETLGKGLLWCRVVGADLSGPVGAAASAPQTAEMGP